MTPGKTEPFRAGIVHRHVCVKDNTLTCWCSWHSIGVTCWDLLASVMRRTAAFWMACSLWSSWPLMHVNRLLQ